MLDKEKGGNVPCFIDTAVRISDLTTVMFRTRRAKLKIVERGTKYESARRPYKGDRRAGECRSLSLCVDYFFMFVVKTHNIVPGRKMSQSFFI